MILSKLHLTEATEIDFSCEVQGTTAKPSSVRFIIEGADFDILCKAKFENNSIKVTIPKLRGIMESGEYRTRIEVLVDDKLFVPMNESIEFLPLVEFDVSKQSVHTIKETVTIGAKFISEDSKEKSILESNLRTVLAEGHNVEKIDNKFVIKDSEGRFLGVVGNEIKLANTPCLSAAQLFKSVK
jgi:hypothetical protein